MSSADVERLLRTFKPGDRVVAALDIYYAAHGVDVRAGTAGVVVADVERPAVRLVTGVVLVRWDLLVLANLDEVRPMGGELAAIATTIDSIDPEPS